MLIFVVFALSISAQQSTITTTRIDGEGLKALLPNKDNKKPLLVNFWATWCGPCHAEFPDLVKIDADYRKKGLNFVLVSVDTPGLIDTGVPEFLESYKATMPSYLLDLPNRREQAKAIKKIAPGFRDMYPLTLLFDRNGKLVYQKLGRINDKVLRMQVIKNLK